MGNRLSKIYTRTGDQGETGLGDGNRIQKNAPRVVAMGDIDELNAQLGLLIEHLKGDQFPTDSAPNAEQWISFKVLPAQNLRSWRRDLDSRF